MKNQSKFYRILNCRKLIVLRYFQMNFKRSSSKIKIFLNFSTFQLYNLKMKFTFQEVSASTISCFRIKIQPDGLPKSDNRIYVLILRLWKNIRNRNLKNYQFPKAHYILNKIQANIHQFKTLFLV